MKPGRTPEPVWDWSARPRTDFSGVGKNRAVRFLGSVSQMSRTPASTYSRTGMFARSSIAAHAWHAYQAVCQAPRSRVSACRRKELGLQKRVLVLLTGSPRRDAADRENHFVAAHFLSDSEALKRTLVSRSATTRCTT